MLAVALSAESVENEIEGDSVVELDPVVSFSSVVKLWALVTDTG